MSDQTHEITKVIDLTEDRFRAVAATGINYEAEKGFAMQLLMNNDYLMRAANENKASLAQAITNVAAIGLSLNPAKKEAYLLPRTVKEGGKYVTKVFLEPSYMGLCNMAIGSGSIEWVQAQAAYASDKFVDNGPGLRPTHEFNSFAKIEDRGEFIGVYCVAKTSTGDYLTTSMRADEVSDIMERSETVKSYRKKDNSGFGGPWITDFMQQALKTVVRRGFKMWPKKDLNRMAEAVQISNDNEGFEPILTSPNIMDFTADQKAYYDQLIENSSAMEMHIFQESLEQTVRNNLYHSFEKNTKGRYQRIVDDLLRTGQAQIFDYVSNLVELIESGDMVAITDMKEDLSQTEWDHITAKLDPQHAHELEAA